MYIQLTCWHAPLYISIYLEACHDSTLLFLHSGHRNDKGFKGNMQIMHAGYINFNSTLFENLYCSKSWTV